MRAADVMTHRVTTTTPDATVAEAARVMLEHRISGLPVVDAQGTIVGMVTEGDLLRRTETGTEHKRPRWLEFLLGPGRLAGEYVQTHGRKVGEVMTHKAVTVDPSTPLESIVGLMEKHGIKRLPVVEHGRIVGIVSRANLLSALAHLAPLAPETARSDADIRRRIFAEFDRNPWALRGSLDAIVEKGVVELRGVIGDERQREALKIAAENVGGVKKVVDHLVWVEPVSGMAINPPEDDRPTAA
ncbi:MAG TPA: CBS domain-containing protein [Stellaceae bacterium]|nr:CBS domain-containing protein [Stellaceae bacterium]